MFQIPNAAFVVIDNQDFCVNRPDNRDGLEVAAQNIIKLIDDVRLTQSLLVLHVASTDQLAPKPLLYEAQIKFLKDHFNLNFYPGYQPQSHETVFTKETFSAFSNPDFEKELRRNDIKHLYLSGFHTSACVQATAMDALEKNYKVSVIEEATASVNSERTREGLDAIKQAGGEVISMDGFRKITFPVNPLYSSPRNPHCVLG